jgi:hypothetical protein
MLGYNHVNMEKDIDTILQAFYLGDQQLFKMYPHLYYCPIFVHYDSEYPEYSRTKYWNTFGQCVQKNKN